MNLSKQVKASVEGEWKGEKHLSRTYTGLPEVPVRLFYIRYR